MSLADLRALAVAATARTGEFTSDDPRVAYVAAIAALSPERITALLDVVELLAERAQWGEWDHAHCDETSEGIHRLDYDWWEQDARAALDRLAAL